MFFAGIVTCLFCSLIQAQSQSARPDERLWSSQRSDPFAGVKSTVTVPLNVEPLPASAPWVVRTHFGSIMITPNVRIHPNPSTTQSEMSIAIHPVDKNVLLAGSNAVHTTVSAGSQGWYYSTNGGAIWSGRDTLPTHMNLLDMLSDPAVGIDMDGRLFFHALTISVNAFVARSTNNGVNWMQVVVPGSNSNSDKNHLAVDVSPGSPYQNNVYTAFTDFTSSPSPIVFSRSTNHGVTFSSAVTISGSIGSQFAQGVNLAVGPNGESYAAWSGYDSWPPPVATRLGFNKSTDGGANWGVARSIGTVNDLRGELNKGGNFIRVSSFPSLAVDRGTGARSGWMYIVYPEKNPVTPDIFMIRSTDSGITWSVPRRVNTDASGKDQWYPWVSVDPTTGLLAVVYYDSRNFANNDSAQVYVSVSLDGGDSFEDILVSDQPFLPRPISGLAGGYMGDYIGVVALHGSIFPCWNDNRTGTQQAYSARLDLIEVGSPRRISVSPDSLVFGNVFIASAETLGVTLRNIGFPDTLTVSHITSDQGEFVPLETGLTIPGGQARTVPVVFSPVTPPGVKSGTLTIASNDSVQPVVTIPMDGVGNYPPHLTVTPDSLRFVVNEGDSTTSTLTIGNTGLGPLTFSISNTYRRGSARVFGSSRLVPSPMFGTTLNQPRNENSIRHEMKSDLPVSSRPVEGERHRLLSDSTIRIVVVNFGDATAPLLDSLGLAYTLVDPVTFSTVDLTNYDVILLGSVFSWTSLQPINDRQSDIASFINNGGSVVALTQSTTNA